MSALWGWHGCEMDGEESAAVLRTMAAQCGIPTERFRHVTGPGFAIGIDEQRGNGAIVSTEDVVLCVLGSPIVDERREDHRSADIGAELVSRWRTDFEGCLRSLRGGFAVAIIDRSRGRVILAIDRVGGRYPLCFARCGRAVVFATHGGAVARHPAIDASADPQAVFNYLYFHVVPAPRTAWRGVERLAPGCSISFSGSDVQRTVPDPPGFSETAPASLDVMEERFRVAVRGAVARHARSATTGCYLSGGTDSSTVVGMLSAIQDEPVRCYSIGFDAVGYDEMRYARIAAQRFGAHHTEYYLAPDEVIEGVDLVARTFTEPFGNASAVPSYYCARVAREDGVARLLAGDGGDELFAGNERYLKQNAFVWYERLPSWLRNGVVDPLIVESSVGDQVGLVRKARSYVRQARVPLPDRLQWYNVMEREDLSEMLDPEFLAAVDVEEPRRHLREIYHAPRKASDLNRMLALDWVITLADNDLPKVSRTAEAAGIEVAYPLLDDDLLDLSVAVPSGWKIRGRNLRWFFKHALRDFLPSEILTKEKHGFGLPFGVWMRDHPRLQQLAYDSLATLGRRHILRPGFLDRLVALHRDEHPAYYGVFVWVFMMLEQWYRVHTFPTVGE